jgi:hypothetical protein
LLVLASLSLSAQKTHFEPGYIITKAGDTLYGQVKDRSPEPFVEIYQRIRFIPEGRKGRKKYGPDDILGYGVGGRHYAAAPLREESAFFKFRYYSTPEDPPVFLRVVAREGPLTYYLMEFVHDDNNYVDDFPLLHLQGRAELVRATQGIFGLKRERLKAYFKDCPQLLSALEGKDLTNPQEVYDFYLERCRGVASKLGN